MYVGYVILFDVCWLVRMFASCRMYHIGHFLIPTSTMGLRTSSIIMFKIISCQRMYQVHTFPWQVYSAVFSLHSGNSEINQSTVCTSVNRRLHTWCYCFIWWFMLSVVHSDWFMLSIFVHFTLWNLQHVKLHPRITQAFCIPGVIQWVQVAFCIPGVIQWVQVAFCIPGVIQWVQVF